ncbi:MAG: GNAT family N-acetyltransferase [Clostridia bacterium]|nr:GNAT family N-acetyltransferase [Clostridia bacterium]
MSDFPYIETERLILRKITVKDAEDLFETFSSEEAMLYFGMFPFEEIHEVYAMIENFKKGYDLNRMIRFAIELKEEHKVIGTCGFHAYSPPNNRAEVGFELNPKYHQKGYMTEALKALINFGFQILKLNRIEGLVYPENRPSQLTMEKQGFKREGLLRQYMIFRNKPQDLYIYGFLKEEWQNGNQSN